LHEGPVAAPGEHDRVTGVDDLERNAVGFV